MDSCYKKDRSYIKLKLNSYVVPPFIHLLNISNTPCYTLIIDESSYSLKEGSSLGIYTSTCFSFLLKVTLPVILYNCTNSPDI